MGSNSALQIWLKINGALFMGLGFLAYGVKFGLTWHDAGAPFGWSDLVFHPYYNMIITLYTVVGFYLIKVSADPASNKGLLSYVIWGMCFAHGVIATIAVFSHYPPAYHGKSVFGHIPKIVGGLTNWDKLVLACPTWFGLGFLNLFFVKKELDSFLLPWEVMGAVAPPELSGQQLWLKVNGALFMGLGFLAYGVKVGLTWHNAGAPFGWHDLVLHPYYNMIIVLYTVVGFYVFKMANDPAAHKSLLSYVIWGMCFAHGLIATIAVFSNYAPAYSGPSVFGNIPKTVWGFTNWDKLFVACPTWFGLGTINLVFAKKFLGTYLLPHEEMKYHGDEVQQLE